MMHMWAMVMNSKSDQVAKAIRRKAPKAPHSKRANVTKTKTCPQQRHTFAVAPPFEDPTALTVGQRWAYSAICP